MGIAIGQCDVPQITRHVSINQHGSGDTEQRRHPGRTLTEPLDDGLEAGGSGPHMR